MPKNTELTYRLAVAADTAFQNELIRQFGENKAGDMRYRKNTHDEHTKRARENFVAACAAHKQARETEE